MKWKWFSSFSHVISSRLSSRLCNSLQTEDSSPNTAVIVMVVIAMLLSSAVAGVWLVKKYVCGGRSVKYVAYFCTKINELCISSPFVPHVLTRFLVHRYSVMRENVEADKIEGVDDIDTHYMETGKAQYNEDSDQVSGSVSNYFFSSSLWLSSSLISIVCVSPQDLLE